MNLNRKTIIIAAAIAASALLLVIAYVVYQGLMVHLVSSSPASGSSTNVTLTNRVVLTFDRDMSQDNKTRLKITPSIAGDITVQGKTITFVPKASYESDTSYTVSLDAPKGTDGSTGSRVAIQFVPTFVPYDQQTDQQKQDALNITDLDRNPANYAVSSISFEGSDGALNDRGLSVYQLNAFRQALYKYLVGANLKPLVATISNVDRPPFDPSNPVSTFTFALKLEGGQVYNARIETSTLTSVRLYLTDNSGKQIFDSGVVTVNN